MKKLRNSIVMLKMNMTQKFIIAFIFFFIFPTLIIGMVSYNNYVNTIKRNTVNYVTQSLEETIKRIDEYISRMEYVTLMPYYLKDIQGALQFDGNDLNKSTAIISGLNIMTNDLSNNYHIYIFDDFGNVYFNFRAENARMDIKDKYEDFKRIAYKANGSAVVLGTQKVIDTKGRTRYFMTVVRSVKDISTYEQIGVTVADTDIELLGETVDKMDSITKGKTVIVDKDNNVIYASDSTLLTKKYTSELINKTTTEKGNTILMQSGKEYFCIYYGIPATQWKVVTIIPTSEMFKDANSTSKIVIAIASVTSILALIFFVLISYSITKPLRKLTLLMKKVQESDLEVQFNVKYNDEVGMVGTSFNHMVKRIKELIQEVYITNLNKKQIELDALQAQINPHFIYNTLETIRMVSVIHRVNEISELTVIFGKLLRYSTNGTNQIVTIREELHHLEDYLFLQNKRFSNKFLLEINVEEQIKEIETIKLIFQPIVENSIMHGLEFKNGKGKIVITSEVEDGYILLRISDNGIGIEEALLGEINRELLTHGQYNEGRKHIGIRNVNERLKLHYGEECGLSIKSNIGLGTEVTLKLPHQFKGVSHEKNRYN